MQRDLQAPVVGRAQGRVDRGGGGAPVLVHLVAGGARERLLLQRGHRHGVALAEQQDVDGQGIERAVHGAQMPRPRGDRGRLRSFRRSRAATHDRRDPGRERLVDLRGGEQVNVRVDGARRHDAPFPGDDIGRWPDDHVDAVADVGVARVADSDDATVTDADIGADDPPPVQDDRVRDHGVEGAVGSRRRRLRHRLADGLAAAEHGLLAADGEVALDLDPQIGVAEAHLVADRRAVDGRVARPVKPDHRAAPVRRS